MGDAASDGRAQLKTRMAELAKQRRDLGKEIKAAERKRKRVLAAARHLSNDDDEGLFF